MASMTQKLFRDHRVFVNHKKKTWLCDINEISQCTLLNKDEPSDLFSVRQFPNNMDFHL